jgi:7-cyano-7-deazaguanine synthase
MKAIVVVSGGMDSVTALYLARVNADEVRMISFDYGQKHKKELEFARWHAEALGLQHDIVDLTSITHLISNSALTSQTRMVTGTEVLVGKGFHDHIEVPEGHYTDESMKATVVPNRNMMMLSIAIAVAVNDKADIVVAGMHAGDHPIYPDCRPQFVRELTTVARTANAGFIADNFAIWAPFINVSKDVIVHEGVHLGVPYDRTWSCYKGEHLHCGKCGTCVERREAFQLAGVDDPTVYGS